MNLGYVLEALGERETGTEKLEEAAAAYREALKEYTRERAPLDWVRTQTYLGYALEALGERESGTKRLGQAVSAYREALKEWPNEAPPAWRNLAHSSLSKAEALLAKRRRQ